MVNETHQPANQIHIRDFNNGSAFQHYQLLEHIGSGGQGVVWSALDGTHNRIVAIKYIEIDTGGITQKDREPQFEQQIKNLVALNHPNILPILDYGQFSSFQYLVSPYITGGSLLDRIRFSALKRQEFFHLAEQITKALSYLHGRGLIHRDLKPSNILIDSDQNLFLTDFGLARAISLTTASVHTGRGTPPYAPPEQHTLADISPQSDIYSFGIVLYEMLVRQLPWNGDKTLGLQQLHTQDQIPDPHEIDSSIPPDLVVVLRQMTAADPLKRPRSADAVLLMLEAAFKNHPLPSTSTIIPAKSTILHDDGYVGLEPEIFGKVFDSSKMQLNLTNFALKDLELTQPDKEPLSLEATCFMLTNALTYNFKHEYWWSRVSDTRERLATAAKLLRKSNKIITARALHYILLDNEIRKLDEPLSIENKADLIGMAAKTDDPTFRRQILEALRILTPTVREWDESSLNLEQEDFLTTMALEDSTSGNAAASLIGYWRLSRAAESVFKRASLDRRDEALLKIQQQSGWLPECLPWAIRINVFIDWVVQRLRARPLNLFSAFLVILLGTGLPFGIKEYLSVSGSGFMNTLNILLSIERGALLGAPFGLGILFTRIIAERFPEVGTPLRTFLSTVVGGIFLSVSIFTYDVLVLSTVPSGLVYITGCFLIAFGYALGALKPSRLWKFVVSAIAIFIALAGSWWSYFYLADSSFALTPVFFYRASWSPTQILMVILTLTLSMTVLGNISDLSIRDGII